MSEPDDSTVPAEPDLVARTRALIERSSLGERGPRLLRQRASREQIGRIRQLLAQRQAEAVVVDQTAAGLFDP